jgi:dTDP-4-amino-4,6-dideoxygalactose transaminase
MILKWFGLDRDLTKDEKGNWKGQQWDTDVIEAGYKFNMNNVSAAIGLAQLHHIDDLVKKHQHNAKLYDVLFDNWHTVKTPQRSKFYNSASWTYTLVLNSNEIDRDELLKKLNDVGIAAGLVHVPNDAYTCFKESLTELPGVREFSTKQFSIPCGFQI